jgi:arsenite/tail-anchored protein-transporting ATPase
MANVRIFIGKGGVGKSTCASLEAVRSQAGGIDTLLDSMDPAHNLHDIFRVPLSSRGTRIMPGLTIRESDKQKMIRTYLKSIRTELKGIYHYQQALNIDSYFSILSHAPGMEEHAALLVLQRCFDDRTHEQIIIDTPPTALTLKMLALPKVNLEWISHLVEMRRRIVSKKNGVAKIRKEQMATLEEDPVYARLMTMSERYRSLIASLEDSSTTEIDLVMNEDELSLAESLMIRQELEVLGLSVHRVLLNKAGRSSPYVQRIRAAFPHSSIGVVSRHPGELTGMDQLQQHVQKTAIVL